MNHQITVRRLAVVLALMMVTMVALPAFAADKLADADITYWVKDALRHDARIDASEITVSTLNGIVTLAGSVDNLAAKQYADREAKKINGVMGAVNQIIVSPGWRSDVDIRNAVRRRILNSTVIESEGIFVTCSEGKVTVSGTVDAWNERAEAGLLASEVRGVKEVQNNITTKWAGPRTDQEIKNDAVAALARDVYLTGLPVTVSVADGMVMLAGSVGSAYEKDRAYSDVRYISHVKGVSNDLNVEWWEEGDTRKETMWPSDDALRDAVRAELRDDYRVDSAEISVSVSFGHVTLDGSVFNHHEKGVAEQDAYDVVGVGYVVNNLMTRVDKREDWAIRDDVEFNLNTDYLLEGFDLSTRVKDGVVTLSGNVHTWYQKSHAEDVASRVKGVKDVINLIAMHWTDLKEDAELEKTIRNRLEWNWTTFWGHDSINVRVTNGVATLTGDVSRWSKRKEAGHVAMNTIGIRKVDNRLTVKGYDYPWDEWHSK